MRALQNYKKQEKNPYLLVVNRDEATLNLNFATVSKYYCLFINIISALILSCNSEPSGGIIGKKQSNFNDTKYQEGKSQLDTILSENNLTFNPSDFQNADGINVFEFVEKNHKNGNSWYYLCHLASYRAKGKMDFIQYLIQQSTIPSPSRVDKFDLAAKIIKKCNYDINTSSNDEISILEKMYRNNKIADEVMNSILATQNFNPNFFISQGKKMGVLTTVALPIKFLKILIDEKNADINYCEGIPPQTVLSRNIHNLNAVKYIMNHEKFDIKKHNIDDLILHNYQAFGIESYKYLFSMGAKITFGVKHSPTPLFALKILFMNNKNNGNYKKAKEIAELLIQKASEQGINTAEFINKTKKGKNIWPWEVGETVLYELLQIYGRKALKETVKNKLLEVIKYLLDNGADPDITVSIASENRRIVNETSARRVAEKVGLKELFDKYPKNP